IAMQEEMGYMPVVESFDDLLRLRENKSIDEFRNKLYEWYEELPKGKFDTLKKIKSDIKKTNQELKRLEKWRRLDRILFWLQLPVTFIPIISTLFTVTAFSTGVLIRTKESRNSWVAIGR